MTLPTPAEYAAALDKLRPRWEEFFDLGWTSADLTSCAIKPYGHHGLAMALRPGWDLGRVWEWCAEILAGVAGTGVRSRLVHWRRACEAELVATVGPYVVPAELAEEKRRAKL